MDKTTTLSLLAAFGVLLAGCAGAPQHSTHGTESQRIAEEAALESALQAVQAPTSDYKISPADLLEITVFQQKDLDRQIRVGQNGDVSLPLIGLVHIGGMTVNGAEAALSNRFKEYLVDPQVTVFIKEYGNKKVFVLGQVQKPGSLDLPTEANLTVLEAVSMAGGFTPIAAPDRTKVIRNVQGKSQSFTIPVSDITRRGEKQKDLQLQPGDVVYVPQSYF